MWTRGRVPYFALTAVAVSVSLSSTFFAQTMNRPTERLIHQVDHVILASDNAEALYRLFSEKLQIPIAWRFQSYGTFASGGVSLGSINLELLLAQHGPYGLTRMALEPESLSTVLPALDARDVPHAEPAPYSQKDPSGVDHILWTTVGMPLIVPAKTVFLCKYNTDVEERRRRTTDELQKNGGGPLGIEFPAAIVLGVRELTSAESHWTKLLAPVRPTDGKWDLGAGPAIRLVADDQDHLAIMQIKVKSLQRARSFLMHEQLLGLDTEREISMDPSRVSGADIRFVE
jgi:hypothetical protein